MRRNVEAFCRPWWPRATRWMVLARRSARNRVRTAKNTRTRRWIVRMSLLAASKAALAILPLCTAAIFRWAPSARRRSFLNLVRAAYPRNTACMDMDAKLRRARTLRYAILRTSCRKRQPFWYFCMTRICLIAYLKCFTPATHRHCACKVTIRRCASLYNWTAA